MTNFGGGYFEGDLIFRFCVIFGYIFVIIFFWLFVFDFSWLTALSTFV